jgi:hypothetical protein
LIARASAFFAHAPLVINALLAQAVADLRT